jgi:hypothetical protein
MSKAEALSTIKELISDFELNKSYYLSKEFLENHCEEKFIKPFIKALGWDLESKGIAGFLREVITQDRVKTGRTKKAPDYGFGLPGHERRLFYLEAKAPSVKIKTDKDPAFQLRRYGRSGQTPVSILFNFSEFAVYDCTKKQSSNDSASFARNIYLTYEQYVDNFDFIYDTFSHDAVYSGSFHKYTQSETQKKGNVTLDKDFVESLNEWRLKLAKSIAKNNFKYNEEEEQLYTVTKYIAKEQLSESELQELADYTQGQWSDGIGEGFEQESCCEVDGYEIYVSPWHRDQELEVIQK